jgi:hypothetical protein
VNERGQFQALAYVTAQRGAEFSTPSHACPEVVTSSSGPWRGPATRRDSARGASFVTRPGDRTAPDHRNERAPPPRENAEPAPSMGAEGAERAALAAASRTRPNPTTESLTPGDSHETAVERIERRARSTAFFPTQRRDGMPLRTPGGRPGSVTASPYVSTRFHDTPRVRDRVPRVTVRPVKIGRASPLEGAAPWRRPRQKRRDVAMEHATRVPLALKQK